MQGDSLTRMQIPVIYCGRFVALEYMDTRLLVTPCIESRKEALQYLQFEMH